MHLCRTLCLGLCVLLANGVTCMAGKFNKRLSVGDAAPVWKDLPGTDGKAHALGDYHSRLLIVVFTGNQCPVASEYHGRLKTMLADQRPQDVRLVAINANRGKAESLEKMALRARKQDWPFDYLKDESQASAKDYGARTTPTVFLLNAERKIVYMGAIDDNWEAEAAVEHHYLRAAMQAVLAGKTPEVVETRAAGCGISFLQDDE